MMLTVKLTQTQLTDPQDGGLESVVNRACWGSVNPILLNLTIPSKMINTYSKVADRESRRQERAAVAKAFSDAIRRAGLADLVHDGEPEPIRH